MLPISKSIEINGIKEEKKIQITLSTLDSIVEKERISEIDFIKIDVEGYENKIIDGASKALHITKNIYVEISPLRHNLLSKEHIYTFEKLHQYGFSFIGCFGDYFFSKDANILKKYF